MNRASFDESMKRVLAFTNAPKTPAEIEHLQGYLNGSYEALSDMEPFLFEKTCVELCRNMSRGQRPMPGQFRAIYYRLKDEQRTKQPERVCPSCKNTVWVEVQMLETATGREETFAKPCPECQPRHAFKDAPQRAGWVEMEQQYKSHDQQMLEGARRLTAKGARFVIDLIDKSRGKINFHPDVLAELVLRAGDEPKQSNPVVEKIIEKLEVIPAEEAPIDWAAEARKEAV